MAEVQILYVATSNGVYQLANPGKSDRWRQVGEALLGQDVQTLLASPTDPLVAYAGGPAGLMQTTDGGATWSVVQERPITRLALAVDGGIEAHTQTGRLGTSSDQAGWTALDDPAMPVDPAPAAVRLELAQQPPALLVGGGGPLRRSEDGGTTFVPVAGPADVRVLVNPPRLYDYVYAGTANGELWLSKDRGRTWTLLRADLPPIHDLSFAKVQ